MWHIILPDTGWVEMDILIQKTEKKNLRIIAFTNVPYMNRIILGSATAHKSLALLEQ